MKTRPPLPGFAVAGIFFLATLASRVSVLNRSVLDWDESLYFLMARQWLRGQLPYTSIWDNKPIGIYAIFAGFQAVFGTQVFAMRIATVLFISVLAFALFRMTEILTARRDAAWLAGGALVLCALSNDGLSANTELFMATFTALAVWAALATRWGLLVGLLLGAAFMVKYVAMFEAPAVFCLFCWRQRRWGAAASLVAGAAIPLLAVVLVYAHAGQLGIWWDCSVLSNFRRVNAPVTPGALRYAFRLELWRWGPMLALALGMLPWALVRRREREIFLACWLLGGAVGVASAKSFYDHYFLQILPVLCVILGVWFSSLPRGVAWRAGFVVAMLALPAWAAQIALRDASVPDVTAMVARDLKAQNPREIYVLDSQPILYALTDQTPPTRYVLPSELFGRLLPGVAGIDATAEVARILATDPTFIIRRSNPPTDPAVINPAVYAETDQALTAGYALWRSYPGVLVYRVK